MAFVMLMLRDVCCSVQQCAWTCYGQSCRTSKSEVLSRKQQRSASNFAVLTSDGSKKRESLRGLPMTAIRSQGQCSRLCANRASITVYPIDLEMAARLLFECWHWSCSKCLPCS